MKAGLSLAYVAPSASVMRMRSASIAAALRALSMASLMKRSPQQNHMTARFIASRVRLSHGCRARSCVSASRKAPAPRMSRPDRPAPPRDRRIRRLHGGRPVLPARMRRGWNFGRRHCESNDNRKAPGMPQNSGMVTPYLAICAIDISTYRTGRSRAIVFSADRKTASSMPSTSILIIATRRGGPERSARSSRAITGIAAPSGSGTKYVALLCRGTRTRR